MPAAALLVAAYLGVWAGAATAGPAAQGAPSLAVLDFRFFDTSGEPVDQAEVHAARVASMTRAVVDGLAQGPRYHPTAIRLEELGAGCPADDTACEVAAISTQGFDLMLIGVVHKTSNLILSLFIHMIDTASAKRVLYRDLSFRGDTDEAWARAAAFLIEKLNGEPATSTLAPAGALPTPR